MTNKKHLSFLEEYKAYDEMWEWLDAKGNKISTASSQTSNSQSTSATTGPTKIHDLRDKYDKLVSHLRSMYSLNVNRRTAQLLDVDIKVGTKFKNKLIVTYDYQKGCLVGALYDEFGKEASSNNCWGGWSVLIAWLKKEGFPLIDDLCENNSYKESCKFPFSKEDLDAALDNLTDEDEPGLELGDNSENSDVLIVAGEPYGGTKWYVDKWADNFYIITSELWGQDGGGPEEGVYEELDSIDEVWDYLNKLDPLSGVPALKSKKAESMLTEWKDGNNQQITITGHPGGWNLCTLSSPESCEGCGQIVEFNPNLKNNQKFFEPYILQNGHKLCSECMLEWIKLPKGFIDKFLFIGNYDILGGDIDEFIEELKLTQPDINGLVQEWNNKKKQGLIELSQAEILEAEDNFIEAIQKLGLTANKKDFI